MYQKSNAVFLKIDYKERIIFFRIVNEKKTDSFITTLVRWIMLTQLTIRDRMQLFVHCLSKLSSCSFRHVYSSGMIFKSLKQYITCFHRLNWTIDSMKQSRHYGNLRHDVNAKQHEHGLRGSSQRLCSKIMRVFTSINQFFLTSRYFLRNVYRLPRRRRSALAQ